MTKRQLRKKIGDNKIGGKTLFVSTYYLANEKGGGGPVNYIHHFFKSTCAPNFTRTKCAIA